MTTEQKAKAYDEALKRARQFSEHPLQEDSSNIVEYIFPELKESEDERIRKEILHFIKKRDRSGCDYDYDKWIAWLEKQGKKETLCDKCRKEHPSHSCQDITALGRCALEKQDEQKPSNKVEPKFKAGDWVVTSYGKVNQVIAVDEDGDGFTLDDYTYFIGPGKVWYHLWTIQDAKDGDVLASNRSIFIFSQEYIAGKPEAHCGIMNGLFLVKPEGCWTNEECYPATKEQRDLLFQKMKEAGYEWDSETKKLKKIKQTSVDKIEPKFKVGDWIISNNKKSIYQVIEVKRGIYVIRDNADNYEYHIGIEECEKSGKLFTIRDAKDGDVLQLGNVTAIFQEYIGSGNCKCYCSVYNGEFEIPSQDNSYGCHNAIPATKEQRDILFAKMKEAGYEWNTEKKELKKISQRMVSAEAKEALYDKPAWSEEDEDAIRMAIIALEDMYDEDAPNTTYGGYNLPFNKAAERLKELKERYTWKPSDEQIEALESATENCAYSEYQDCLKDLIEQLKKLKG